MWEFSSAAAANRAQAERLPWNLRVAECLELWNSRVTLLWLAGIGPHEWAARVCREIERVLTRPRERQEQAP